MNLIVNLQDGQPGYQTRIFETDKGFTLQALYDENLMIESQHATMSDAARELVACWFAEYAGEPYCEIMRNLKAV